MGFIGLGQRGAVYVSTESIGLLGNVLKNSADVVVTVICDKFQERLDAVSAKIVAHGYPASMQTTNYKEVMNAGLDAIIISTSRDMHVQVALEGMQAGIPVAMKVGGTHSIEDGWKLVDCYEKTGTPIFFMENCCYNKDETLVTALVRKGLMGEVVYCQGYYAEYLNETKFDSRQIYFVNQVVEYIVRNGLMKDLTVLQETPFTDYGSIVDIFVWFNIREIIESINANARVA